MASLAEIFGDIYLLTKEMADNVNDEKCLLALIEKRQDLINEYEDRYNSSKEKTGEKFPDKLRLKEINEINSYIISELEKSKKESLKRLQSITNRQKDLYNRQAADKQRFVQPGVFIDTKK